jgi:hypothetical protein
MGITMVLNTLARKSPGACLDENNAETNEIMYMEAIKMIPTIAEMRFTLFITYPFYCYYA